MPQRRLAAAGMVRGPFACRQYSSSYEKLTLLICESYITLLLVFISQDTSISDHRRIGPLKMGFPELKNFGVFNSFGFVVFTNIAFLSHFSCLKLHVFIFSQLPNRRKAILLILYTKPE